MNSKLGQKYIFLFQTIQMLYSGFMTVKPFKENELFRSIPRHPLNACVGNNGGPYDLFDYSAGYFRGTRILLSAMSEQRNSVRIDTLVYPICFNFRHAIELYIKYMVTDLSTALQLEKKFRFDHTILKNWETAKQLAKDATLPAEEDEIDFFDQTVAAVSEVDPNGQIFRYPETIKGDQHLAEWSHINLKVVELALERTFDIAKTWNYRIEDLLDR
jgi:hypothetical protein